MITFRELKEEDIPSILEIEKKVHSAPWGKHAFLGELKNTASTFLVAFIENELIGYAGVWHIIDEAHIVNIAIDPQYQSKGYGRVLLMKLLRFSLDSGMACATLELRESNEKARKLYESIGFKVASVRKKYYTDNAEDAIVMWLHDLASGVS